MLNSRSNWRLMHEPRDISKSQQVRRTITRDDDVHTSLLRLCLRGALRRPNFESSLVLYFFLDGVAVNLRHTPRMCRGSPRAIRGMLYTSGFVSRTWPHPCIDDILRVVLSRYVDPFRTLSLQNRDYREVKPQVISDASSGPT